MQQKLKLTSGNNFSLKESLSPIIKLYVNMLLGESNHASACISLSVCARGWAIYENNLRLKVVFQTKNYATNLGFGSLNC